MKRLLTVSVLVCVATSLSASLSAQSRRSVLIRAAQPYDALVNTIEQAGGSVTHRFKHVKGLAAEVPDAALAQLEQLLGPDNISRDEIIALPSTTDPRGGAVSGEAEADGVVSLEGAGGEIILPANYNFNATLTNVGSMHAAGLTGAGIVIAVIDSGFRPIMQHVGPARLISPGLNLVPGATEPPAIANANEPHGTFVSGMAAANIAFCFGAANKFVVVAEHYGAAIAGPPCPATARLVPMVGSAPGASIFPIKVFPAAGGGTPTSRVIAAIEAAIELRRKFDNGEAGGLNIRVANLSLGGPTQAAAREIDDEAIEALIDADIVPVVAAGNEGFSSVTTGSPSTSFAALTVGSASDHRHEQIFRAQFSAPCGLASTPLASVLACAQAYRPDTNVQVSEFSSRGPTHDGRIDPDVVAIGSFNFSQGGGTTSGTVNFGSGTSYATPTVSGIAAVLRQAVPTATARQVRNAIIMSADASRIPSGYENDRGYGFVNAAAARALLAAGNVPDSYQTSGFTRNLRPNLQRAGKTVYSGTRTLSFTNVKPAEVTDIPYVVGDQIAELRVRIHSIVPALPLAQQNQLFTDDVLLKVQSSTVHNDDYRVPGDFLVAGTDKLYTFTRPEAGIWRVSPSGDWTNAGTISYKIDISTITEPFASPSDKDRIDNGEIHVYTFDVPAGATTLGTRLEWMNMNGNYPISDLDVVLTPPTGPVVTTCSTARTPEICSVAKPVAGTWTARVIGFSIPEFGVPSGKEHYTLRIKIDDDLIALKRQ
jgi:subtilisin family serine protease